MDDKDDAQSRGRLRRLELWKTLVAPVLVGVIVGAFSVLGSLWLTRQHEISGPTEIRTFSPFAFSLTERNSGLADGFKVTRIAKGGCSTGASNATPLDEFTHSCAGLPGYNPDPCWARLFGQFHPGAGPRNVFCVRAPWDADVLELHVGTDWVRGGVEQTPPSAQVLPWAVELANGKRCVHSFVEIINPTPNIPYYGCDGGGSVFELDKRNPIWLAAYEASGAPATQQVSVTTAWY